MCEPILSKKPKNHAFQQCFSTLLGAFLGAVLGTVLKAALTAFAINGLAPLFRPDFLLLFSRHRKTGAGVSDT
jgi:hypothetical protein